MLSVDETFDLDQNKRNIITYYDLFYDEGKLKTLHWVNKRKFCLKLLFIMMHTHFMLQCSLLICKGNELFMLLQTCCSFKFGNE